MISPVAIILIIILGFFASIGLGVSVVWMKDYIYEIRDNRKERKKTQEDLEREYRSLQSQIRQQEEMFYNINKGYCPFFGGEDK